MKIEAPILDFRQTSVNELATLVSKGIVSDRGSNFVTADALGWTASDKPHSSPDEWIDEILSCGVDPDAEAKKVMTAVSWAIVIEQGTQT